VALLPQTCSLYAPCLRLREREHAARGLAGIRDLSRDGPGIQQWGASEILPGHDHMADMHCTLRDEPIAPTVKRRPELRGARGRLGEVSIGTEAKVRSPDGDRMTLRMPWRCDMARWPVIGA